TLGIAHVASDPATTSGKVRLAGSKREKTGPEPNRDEDDAHDRMLESAPICVSDNPAASAITGWNVFVTALRLLMKNITSTPTQTASGRPVTARTIGRRGGGGAATPSSMTLAPAVRDIRSAATRGVSAST